MFNSKLNYLTCGFALAFLLLLGRFFFMQVVNHEAYTAAAEDVRLRKELLPPSRAAIYAAGGTLVARSETVWDVYIDWNEFSQPHSMRLRALVAPGDYDPGAVQAFLEGPAREVETASLAAPAARRRFFLTWRLRDQEAARHDLRQSLARLSMVTRVPQERIEEKLALVQAEVDGLLAELGDVTTARANDVNVAWLRAKPALSDSEYWNRVKRYPRSTAFLPALEARLKWSRHEAEYLQAMLQRAGDDRQARDLCGQAARNCEARALALAPDDESARSLEPAAREERAAFRRLFSTCSEGVHRGAVALREALDALQGPAGRIAALEDRALSLRRDTVERFQGDYERRWRHYTFEENPLLLLRDAPRDVVELLKVNADLLPGVSCRLRASRAYAHASLLAPVLGSSAIQWRRERAPARLRSLARVLLADTRLLIIVSTLGGYAGSTLAPYLARTACEMEIPVAGVLTMPLDSELVARHRTAQDGLWALRQLLQVHVVIDSKALLASGRFNNKPVDKFFDAARTEMSHAVADIAQQRQHLWSKLTSET